MTIMSRPILTKKITRNDTVYNLEMWSSQSDPDIVESQYYPSESQGFRKDFFNEVDMTGDWSNSQVKYQERFDVWFDKLPVDKKLEYAKAIDESNRIIITMVWDLVSTRDKQELFNNNLRQFSVWFSDLEPSDIDFYMTRINNKQPLIPTELTSQTETLSEEEVTVILGKVYDSIDDDLIRATTINGLLCISCTDESRLQKAKKHMVRHGSILRDYRKKENANGRLIYTYIFSKP